MPSAIFILSLPLALNTTVSKLKYYARTLFVLSCIVFILFLVIIFLCEKNDLHAGEGYIRECVSDLYQLHKMDSQALPLHAISTLTQIPNISAQYNFDTFLIQFHAKIRTKESGVRETLKSCIIALVWAFFFYLTVNIIATHIVTEHSSP